MIRDAQYWRWRGRGGSSNFPREALSLDHFNNFFFCLKIIFRGPPTTHRLQKPRVLVLTFCPPTGCCPSGPPGGGALNPAASHWPVELAEEDLSGVGPAAKGSSCYCYRGLVCKDSRKGHEGLAPPGPTQPPCGLFINQESAPNWAHYQLGFSGAAGRC